MRCHGNDKYNLILPSHKMKLSLVQKLGIQHKSRAVSS